MRDTLISPRVYLQYHLILQFLLNLVYMLTMARSSCDDSALRYVLPVVWMTSRLPIIVWFPCGRLSWLHVSFWAHVNIVHHIIISQVKATPVGRMGKVSQCSAEPGAQSDSPGGGV